MALSILFSRKIIASIVGILIFILPTFLQGLIHKAPKEIQTIICLFPSFSFGTFLNFLVEQPSNFFSIDKSTC